MKKPCIRRDYEIYTGLPTIKVLKAVVRLVNKAFSYFCRGKPFGLFQQFMAIIVKLCLNCPVQVLAYCPNRILSYTSNVFEVYEQQWTNAYAC